MRTYDKDFKMNAVNLYKSSGRSLKTIAEELGLAISTLSQLVQDYKKEGGQSFPGKGQLKPHEEELKARSCGFRSRGCHSDSSSCYSQ
jgi:transposase